MSLPLELGTEYIREHLIGSLFRKGNEIAFIRGCDSYYLQVATIDLNSKDNMEWVNKNYPHSALNSFKDLAWPRLGYRNMAVDEIFGNVTPYLTSQRSVHRGLREELIESTFPAVYDSMMYNPRGFHPYSNTLYRISQIFDPTWIEFKEGMAKIASGEILGFAMNEDLAIAISVDQGPDKYCDLLFRGRVVGSVTENGELILTNAVIKRSSLKRLYKLMGI